VVNRHQSAVRPADLAAGIRETLESLRGGHLMDEMPVCFEELENHFKNFKPRGSSAYRCKASRCHLPAR
jgi:hypothetical protein